ncbi:MAG: NADH-quinone oxidoreductase subunit L [Bacteroidota bacterium]
MKLIVTLIPLLPLIGFLILGLGFKRIPRKVTSLIATGTIFISFFLSVITFFALLRQPGSHEIDLFNWISFSQVKISFSFLIDPLSSLMLLIITGIGFLIHLYSIGYMHDDPGYNRFFAYMNLFVFSMLLLVMGSNFVILFIGWEGVGLCSYLLIGFWFRDQQNNNAAKKAFIMNRIGDLGFLIGIFLLFMTFHSFNYLEIFSKAKLFPSGSGVIIAITLFMFIGAVGKSAQIPLYTWLPDAMAGPTPVSALIHAATMVTAGVYMIARSNILYVLAPVTMQIIGITGLVTALLAASIAIFQNDIKKVLAYSTISQLGYMFLGLSVGAFTGAMFHLTTHAFFKALLFLAAGSVIHALGGEQDIRKMGGLKKALPKTHLTFLVATLAIAGIPPLSGFFSKDEILMATLTQSVTLWIFATIGAMMTVFYMFRLYYLVFVASSGQSGGNGHLPHESPPVMTIPLIVLALLAGFGGFLNIPHILGGNDWLNGFLSPVFSDGLKFLHPKYLFTSVENEIMIMLLPVVYASVMIILAFKRYIADKKRPDVVAMNDNFFSRLIYHKYYIDEIYDALVEKPILWLSKRLHEIIEVKLIDRIVNGFGSAIVWAGGRMRYVQTGHVGFYLFIMVFGIIAILLFNILIF